MMINLDKIIAEIGRGLGSEEVGIVNLIFKETFTQAHAGRLALIQKPLLQEAYDCLAGTGQDPVYIDINIVDSPFQRHYMEGVGLDGVIDFWRIIMPGNANFRQIAVQYMTSNPAHAKSLLQKISADAELSEVISSASYGSAEKPRDYRLDLLRSFHQLEPNYRFHAPNLQLPGMGESYSRKLRIANDFIQRNQERMIRDYGVHININFDPRCTIFYDNNLPNTVAAFPFAEVDIKLGKGAFDLLSDSAFEGMFYHSLANVIHAQQIFEAVRDTDQLFQIRGSQTFTDKLDAFDRIAIELFNKEKEVRAYRQEIAALGPRSFPAKN